jgi:dipeptidyl aminopeptidase/acylaminoacyl peptidase
MKKLLFFVLALIPSIGNAQQDLRYQSPDDTLKALALAPLPPQLLFSLDNQWMVFLQRPGYPSIEDLSKPEKRLAGLRFDPKNFGSSRQLLYTGLEIKSMKGRKGLAISGLPERLKVSDFRFSPSGKYVSFVQNYPDKLELWFIDLSTGKAAKAIDRTVHGFLGSHIWLSGDQGLVVSLVPQGRTDLPADQSTPIGPTVDENLGKKAPSRTYQDLLKKPADELAFEYYASSEIWLVVPGKSTKKLKDAGLYTDVSGSPDGRFLMIEQLKRPFSYLVPFNRFPRTISVMAADGSLQKTLADLPLQDQIPNGFNAVEKEPRYFNWRADAPATICYVQAMDEGDPKKKADKRDAVYLWQEPWQAPAKLLMELPLRFAGITWGDEKRALIYESWWADRKTRTYLMDPSGATKPKVLFDRSSEDRYNDPGSPLTKLNSFGRNVIAFGKKGNMWLSASGASAEGDYPFIQEFDPVSGKKKVVWKCEPGWYEYPLTVLDFDKGSFVTFRQNKTTNPNYYLRTLGSKTAEALTQNPNPYPLLEGIQKQFVKYRRSDSLELTADLYLPKGYEKSQGPLPTLIWAYPREFKSADHAAQVRGSMHMFTRLNWGSPLFWVAKGYAVIDNASMPIVGEGSKEPNDTFLPQLVDNARAAIQFGAALGVVDSTRVAVGGHSYGAFMTANLLAHSDLFKTGIARSGAYNRTLTPFGFQSEERTYWEAPEVYFQMSPFSFANKINEPILMIHGEADNNPGTFPLQSERLYNAIKGHGGTARYVVLPSESHGYAAEESILHMLWEMDRWLSIYLKK